MAAQQFYGEQQQYGSPQYQQPPPGYGPGPGPDPKYNNSGTMDNKQSFEQTFKIDKPKYNDLWAGILVVPIGPSSFGRC